MLRELAKNGGVAMVNLWAMLLDDAHARQSGQFLKKNLARIEELRDKHAGDMKAFYEELEKLKAQEAPIERPPLSKIVDHIAKVAGVDHVGLGSDFDGVDALPAGLSGIDGLPQITLELLRRGYKDEEILKIPGRHQGAGPRARPLPPGEALFTATRGLSPAGPSARRA
jgi:membrane dipeptidase